MENIMPFIYGAMWLIICVGIFYVGRKNNYGAVTGIASVMFLFMGIWWIIDGFLPKADLLSGTYGWIFRIIIAVFVLFIILFYLRFKKNKQ